MLATLSCPLGMVSRSGFNFKLDQSIADLLKLCQAKKLELKDVLSNDIENHFKNEGVPYVPWFQNKMGTCLAQ